jgi:lipopolysaccharide/colanic/teichoic acid biosynthesis glycosyltransferase
LLGERKNLRQHREDMESYTHLADHVSVRVPATGTRRSRRTEPSDGKPIERARQIEAVREVDVAEPVVDVVPRERSERLNRVVNLTLGLIALALLAPFFVLAAIAIKLTSRGPIFYTQTRVGIDRRGRRELAIRERRLQDLGGAAFTIYKFRSMYVNAEGKSGAVWATVNDPRVTPLGRFMRKFRVDEWPQLINVVKGDMNLVGPRPERPSIVARLREDIREYPLRQRVKPGITGLAQINLSYDSCLDDVRAKVRYDLEYLRCQSMAEDLLIMVKTVPTMVLKVRGW